MSPPAPRGGTYPKGNAIRVGIALLLTAGVVLANAPLPPVPKGMKRVAVTHMVKLEKELKGYTLFTMPSGPWAQGDTPTKFAAGMEMAVKVPGGGKSTSLNAVPEDLVPSLKTTGQWLAAIRDPKSGIHEETFRGLDEVDETDDRKAVERTWVIKGIDSKGILREEAKEGKDDKKQDKKDKPLALTEPGTLIGGVAAAVSITLGGLWLVRRRK